MLFFCTRPMRIVLSEILFCLSVAPCICFGQLSALPPQPWPNARSISVSFAPDLVEIGRFRNELSMRMNDHLNSPNWQIEILRSLQCWSKHCGVQFAVVADSLRAFGVPGLSQSDPRFGDIRIGAFPQTNALGNVVAFHPAHGSWSGDLFFDSSRSFTIHDWSSGSNPTGQVDLFTVALHEIGNALGLVDDTQDPQSVMFQSYVGARTDLSTQDINQIQTLYGPPLTDNFEPVSGNNTFSSATDLVYPPDFQQTLILNEPGRMQGPNDCDVYRLQFTTLSEKCWVKLRSRRISLLCGRITVYDQFFNELATIAAENPLQNTVVKEITSQQPGDVVYIVVESAGLPEFDFGDYELVVDFNPDGYLEEDEGEEGDDGEDPQFFESGDRELVNELFDEIGLADTETGANDNFRDAVRLMTAPGFGAGSRFEAVNAIASRTDVDYFQIQTSRSARGSMAIELSPLGLDPALLDVRVFDGFKNIIRTRTRYRLNGEVYAEVPRVQPNTIYYVTVSNRQGNVYDSNYLLLIQVANTSAKLNTIHEFQLTPTNDDVFGVVTNFKTQLYRIDISMTSSDSATQASQLTVYSDTGREELVTSVRPGQDSVNFVWLHAGEHYLRVTARTRDGANVLSSRVIIRGAAVSDDNGPILIDLSGNPISNPQSPGREPTPQIHWLFPVTYSWLNQLLLPIEDPWL